MRCQAKFTAILHQYSVVFFLFLLGFCWHREQMCIKMNGTLVNLEGGRKKNVKIVVVLVSF